MAPQKIITFLVICGSAMQSLAVGELQRNVGHNGTILRSFPKVEKIRMRDGVLLHSVLTLPGPDTEKYSCVIDRSPYGPFGTELIADAFLLAGYAALGQDFRGTYQSEGDFNLWKNSYNDTYDTIQWIQKQPWSNGEIFMVGASADGIATLVLAANPAIPAIKTQFIVWATASPYADVYPGGAYRDSLIHGWLKGTVKKENYTILEHEVYKHESPMDPWWNDITPKYQYATTPTVFWAGWNDIFLNGNLAAFNGWQGTNGNSWLVVDPLGHCQDAGKDYPYDGIIDHRIALSLFLGVNMFNGDLNTSTPQDAVPEKVKRITVFVMGANQRPSTGNFWTTFDEWPTNTPTKYYMQQNHMLSETPRSAPGDHLSYLYNPTNPVPTIGGNNLEIKCGPEDQKPVLDRDDVLEFTTPELTTAVPVLGNLTATLFVSSSNVNDTDFTVKLMDVYPDGASHLIQDGIVRMRWREGGLNPVPMKPNTVYEVSVSLWATAYVFEAGHRIGVAVSSSNALRFTPNPNTGLPLTVANQQPKLANNTLHLSGNHASYFTLPHVTLAQLPKHLVW
eukprot:m.45537 g.45537  ORF g.45537 m.45537 type:complete len:563 (-) comp15135_c0_seq5:1057-2745(-)